MKDFFIITNQQKDEELKLTHKIQSYIQEKGGSCQYGLNQQSFPKKGRNWKTEGIPEKTECILCIGGDGTLIQIAREVVKKQIPMIGINRGHVGYLCELDCDSVFSAIDRLMEDSYVVEERMMLEGYLTGFPKDGELNLALNDIVIHRTGRFQIIDFVIYVNGKYLNTYSADGIIVATPTGSTAYSMSAGGPIVDPKAELLLITPISPHGFNSRSIVLGAEDQVMVEIAPRRKEADEEVEVCFDGEQSFQMKAGDKLAIQRGESRTRILKLGKLSFLEIWRKKMQEHT